MAAYWVHLVGNFAGNGMLQFFITGFVALYAARVGVLGDPIALRVVLILVVVGLVELELALQCLEHHIAILVELAL